MARSLAPSSRRPAYRPCGRGRTHVRATVGELIAAAYDAVGGHAGAADVARLLRSAAMARALQRRFEIR